MDASIGHSTPPFPCGEADLLLDRRRSGRAEADPALVPLLRETGHSELVEFADGLCLDDAESRSAMDGDGDSNVVKGIIFGLMLSMPFWLVTALIGVMILR